MSTLYALLFVIKFLVVITLTLTLSLLAGVFVVDTLILSSLGKKHIAAKLYAIGILFGVFAWMDYAHNYSSIAEWHNAIIENGMTQADYINYAFMMLAFASFLMAFKLPHDTEY